MIIPRLLALGALAYAGLRLRERLGRSNAPARRPAGHAGAAEPVRDVLVEDPVCGKLAPRREALTLEVGGVTHYFCGEACRLAYQLQTGRAKQARRTEQTQGERTA